ncbi:MAG: hypothetical protein AAGF73_15230 [Actinomycetota bacterium]
MATAVWSSSRSSTGSASSTHSSRPVGAVIGPTQLEPRLDLVSPNALYLAPGVGHQGATPQDVADVFADCPDRVFPSASRSLLGGPDPARLRDDAQALAEQFKTLLRT